MQLGRRWPQDEFQTSFPFFLQDILEIYFPLAYFLCPKMVKNAKADSSLERHASKCHGAAVHRRRRLRYIYIYIEYYLEGSIIYSPMI